MRERIWQVRSLADLNVLRDRRGAIAPLVALTLPALVGAMALTVDVGFFYVEQQRLQVAADTAAIDAALLLPTSPSASQLQSAAQQGVTDAVGNAMIGKITKTTVSATTSSATVTLVSQSNGFFAQALKMLAPTLTATATAGLRPASSCVLALSPSLVNAIYVHDMGSITASGCGIFSDSSASSAIYLNSGTISGNSVGAVGKVLLSNSGSNTLSPKPAVSGATAKADPYAGLTAPTPGSCSTFNLSTGFPNGTNFGAWQSVPYHFTQSTNVFCGNTTIGGNGSSDTFAPGIYYVVNGSLTFYNANVTSAAGVTFVLTGTSPGGFFWTNNSGGTLTAPTSGATAGILVWQTCGSGGVSPGSQLEGDVLAGGSTLQASGALYMPCGALTLSGRAQLTTASGGSMSVIAETLDVGYSASIAASASGTSTGGAISVVLQQ
jgi:Flp pilus assembly protein TadG